MAGKSPPGLLEARPIHHCGHPSKTRKKHWVGGWVCESACPRGPHVMGIVLPKWGSRNRSILWWTSTTSSLEILGWPPHIPMAKISSHHPGNFWNKGEFLNVDPWKSTLESCHPHKGLSFLPWKNKKQQKVTVILPSREAKVTTPKRLTVWDGVKCKKYWHMEWWDGLEFRLQQST